MKYRKYRPTNPLNRGFKEQTIVTDLDQYLKTEHQIDIIHNQKIQGGSSIRRPDILINLPTYSIIIEIDERQHQTYQYKNDAKQRLIDIQNDLNNKPLVIIRFNPDSYKDSNNINKRSLFNKTRRTRIYKIGYPLQYKARMDLLKDTIIFYIKNTPTNIFTEHKLYFDKFSENEFHSILKK